MIEVHIWIPKGEMIGHSSATIKSKKSNDLAYVSWWPMNGEKVKLFNSVNGMPSDFQSDVDAEKRMPDFTLKFDQLNEDRAIEWWRWYIIQENHKYKLASTNCSWAVIKALKAAGADQFFSWVRFFTKGNVKLPVLNISSTLYKYIREAYEQSKKETKTKTKVKVSMVNLLDKFSSTWSPLDVNKYCQILIQAINGEDSFSVGFEMYAGLKVFIGVDLIRNDLVVTLKDEIGVSYSLKSNEFRTL